MNNREAMQKAFESSLTERCKEEGSNQFYIDVILRKDEAGNYTKQSTEWAFKDFNAGYEAALASQAHQLSGNSVQLSSNPLQLDGNISDCNKVVRSILENTTNNHIPDVGKMVQSQAQQPKGNLAINNLAKQILGDCGFHADHDKDVYQRIRSQIIEAQELQSKDTQRIDWLQSKEVDLIQFDNFKLLDVKNGDVRKAIDAAMSFVPPAPEGGKP